MPTTLHILRNVRVPMRDGITLSTVSHPLKEVANNGKHTEVR